MSRLLAIEWDAKELRVLAGRTKGRGMTVERAWTIELAPRDASQPSETEVSSRLSELIQKEGLARSEALVAIGRSSIELKFLSTPPAPAEELADLVRFQALRQFTSLGDDWPLDYLVLGSGSDGGTNVLAAAISPEIMRQTQAVCQAAQLTLKQLSLRPIAAAGLLSKRHADDRCRMLVDLLPSDVDLSVLIGPQVIFPRTVRLPTSLDPAVQAKALVGEIRRTVIAAQNQLGGRRVEQVVIFGDGQHHATVKSLVERELALEVELLDPFSLVEVSGELRSKLPEFPGTYAPLLGMLEQHVSPKTETINFLSPRRRPQPPDRKRLYTLSAATALAVAAAVAFLIYWELGSLDDKIRALNNQLSNAKTSALKAAKPRADVEQLEKFVVGDVTWLDSMDALSRKFPTAKEARVEEFFATSIQPVGERPGGGKVIVQGVASEASVINRMERQAAAEGYNVAGSGAKFDAEAPDLKWRFKEEFTLYPSEIEEVATETSALATAVDAKPGDEKPATEEPEAAKPAAEAKASSGSATGTSATGGAK